VEEGGQWGLNEAMQTEIDEDEDAEVWYYGIADEEELRQEEEFWRTLLRATSKNGEIPALFRELVEGHNFERVRYSFAPSTLCMSTNVSYSPCRAYRARLRHRAGLEILIRRMNYLRKPLSPHRAPFDRALTHSPLLSQPSSNLAQIVLDPPTNLDRFVPSIAYIAHGDPRADGTLFVRTVPRHYYRFNKTASDTLDTQ